MYTPLSLFVNIMYNLKPPPDEGSLKKAINLCGTGRGRRPSPAHHPSSCHSG